MFREPKTHVISDYRPPGALLFLILSTLLPLSSVAEPRVYSSGSRQVSLIELFTSQGCSSCPPAEAWLGRLRDDPRLWREWVPVAFHVDYWDDLGWRDIFSAPAFSDRQRRYKRLGRVSSVYTPGFVVNGGEWRSWYGLRTPPAGSATTGELTVTLDDDHFDARYRDPRVSGPLRLNIALLGVDITTAVKAGENAGRQLHHDFTVLRYMELVSNDHSWSGTLAATNPRAGAIALWVDRPDDPTPLQATGGWLFDETARTAPE